MPTDAPDLLRLSWLLAGVSRRAIGFFSDPEIARALKEGSDVEEWVLGHDVLLQQPLCGGHGPGSAGVDQEASKG